MTGASGISLFTGVEGKQWTTVPSTKPSVPEETSSREDGSGSRTSTFRREDSPVSRRNKLLPGTGRQITSGLVIHTNSTNSSARNLSTQVVNDTTTKSPSKVFIMNGVRRVPSFHPASQEFHDFYLPRAGKKEAKNVLDKLVEC